MPKQKETVKISKEKNTKILMEWTAPEYIQQEKNKKWFIVAGAVALLFAFVSAITDNLTLAVAILVFAGVYYYLQTKHPPKTINIKITDMGIYAGNMFFPYGNISAFWIIYHDHVKTLNLRIANRYHSDIVIQFDGQAPAPVRNYLVGQIPEWEGKEESFSETFFRLIKL